MDMSLTGYTCVNFLENVSPDLSYKPDASGKIEIPVVIRSLNSGLEICLEANTGASQCQIYTLWSSECCESARRACMNGILLSILIIFMAVQGEACSMVSVPKRI